VLPSAFVVIATAIVLTGNFHGHFIYSTIMQWMAFGQAHNP